VPHFDEDKHLTPSGAAQSATMDAAHAIGKTMVRLRAALDRTERGSVAEELIRHDIARLDAAWSAMVPSTLPMRLPPRPVALQPSARLSIAAGAYKNATELLSEIFALFTSPMVQAKEGGDTVVVSIIYTTTEYKKTCDDMANVLRANGYEVK
jgi:hypothetical protein